MSFRLYLRLITVRTLILRPNQSSPTAKLSCIRKLNFCRNGKQANRDVREHISRARFTHAIQCHRNRKTRLLHSTIKRYTLLSCCTFVQLRDIREELVLLLAASVLLLFAHMERVCTVQIYAHTKCNDKGAHVC